MNPLKQWRYWILLLLLVGPILVYLGLGMLWLWERGWLVLGIATTLWVLGGHPLLDPRRPVDEVQPPGPAPARLGVAADLQPARPRRLEAGSGRADEGDKLPYESLLEIDTYINSGRQLFQRLAVHYHPLADNPIDDVPLIELLTALELATEDLARLCRQVPGRRYHHALALADGGPGRRLHLQGERPVFLPAAVPESGRRPGPVGFPRMDREAGVEEHAAEHAALVLPGLCRIAWAPTWSSS